VHLAAQHKACSGFVLPVSLPCWPHPSLSSRPALARVPVPGPLHWCTRRYPVPVAAAWACSPVCRWRPAQEQHSAPVPVQCWRAPSAAPLVPPAPTVCRSHAPTPPLLPPPPAPLSLSLSLSHESREVEVQGARSGPRPSRGTAGSRPTNCSKKSTSATGWSTIQRSKSPRRMPDRPLPGRRGHPSPPGCLLAGAHPPPPARWGGARAQCSRCAGGRCKALRSRLVTASGQWATRRRGRQGRGAGAFSSRGSW